jgi:uncharacterized membrane protein
MHDGDFRVRGKEISRIEGLSDAVFGFAITLLAISLEVPKTSAEVLHALRGVPAFAVTFFLLFNMWRTQFTFFRRYGIEDRTIVGLTAALLFVLLVFVYPLKFIMGAFIDTLFANLGFPDAAPHEIAAISKSDLRTLLTAFGFGLAAVFGVFSAMYRHAYTLRAHLQLDAVETFDTLEFIRVTTRVSMIGAALGVAYLVGLLAPRLAELASNVAAVAVLAMLAVVFRQRRTRGKRRMALRQQQVQQVGAEA